jgi:hypothetical protein
MIDTPDGQGNDSNSNNYPTNNYKEIARAIQSISDEQRSSNNQSNAQHGENIKWAKRTFWIVFGYASLTFIIAAAGIYAGWQAHIAAAAAASQANIISDQERKQLRGYLGVTGVALSCGDCGPSDKDRIVISFNNFGQTPAYVILTIFWPFEYANEEQFPDNEGTRSPPQGAPISYRSIFVYPKSPISTGFTPNNTIMEFITDARKGKYWLMLRIAIQYRDIFNDYWNNYSCFLYGPSRYGSGFVGCPNYDEERPAKEQQPPPMIATQLLFPAIAPEVPRYIIETPHYTFH